MSVVGVGDENLSEVVFRYFAYDIFDPFGIEFVEYIVEKQYRCFARYLFEENELCQFHCYQIALALPLRCGTFQRKTVEGHIQVVFVYPCRSEAEIFIFRSRL